MSDEPFDLMGYVEEEAQSGGGGLITEVQIDGAWVVFHKGKTTDETSWVFNSKEEGAEKKALALEYIDEHDVKNKKGQTARPYVGFKITQYAESVLNRDEIPSWTDGKISRIYVGFGKAYQEIIKPSLTEYVGPDKQFQYGERFWAQVGFASDPENPTYLGNDGEEKPNLVPYIAYAFADRKEALEAAQSDDLFAFISIPDEPEGYDSDLLDPWDTFARDTVKIFFEDPEYPIEKMVMPKYGLTKKVVKKLRNEARAMKAEDESEIPF
jgi:hypothetical protein